MARGPAGNESLHLRESMSQKQGYSHQLYHEKSCPRTHIRWTLSRTNRALVVCGQRNHRNCPLSGNQRELNTRGMSMSQKGAKNSQPFERRTVFCKLFALTHARTSARHKTEATRIFIKMFPRLYVYSTERAETCFW